MKKINISLLLMIAFFMLSPYVHAQTTETTVQWGTVVSVQNTGVQYLPGNQTATVQELLVEITQGSEKGQTLSVRNDFDPVAVKDKILVRIDVSNDGAVRATMYERNRTIPLLVLTGCFVIFVIALGGKQGVMSLLSLAGSIFSVVYLYAPMLIRGYPPVLVSIAIGLCVAAFAIFVTHGFRRSTALAFSATVLSVGFAVLVTALVSLYAHFTGFASEEAVYLSMNLSGNVDIAGIMMGSVIIGMLGVLDDIAVTQVSVVYELRKALPRASVMDIFWRGLRVGRDHASALVNTLVLAYVGGALPLILFLASSEADIAVLLNQERFAMEIVRTLVGSMGLIVCVPIATLLAARFISVKDDVKGGCPGCAGTGKHHH